ncbi:Gfo/Idh/MocA family protein [Streptomyces sp. NPDC088354]|uniref:Gfo/Idh/MocA family protein n=1 Tax=Streptomyces sp. NPDC088354 TaxID=3365856 RepID=UPI0038174F60
MRTIGAGIIGGWASISHIPVVTASPAYELRAVSTSRRGSAEAAAARYGVAGYVNHRELLAHPGIDLVVVAVKVSEHLELLSAAMEAGKHVYSEWPLGNGLAEAQHLTELAEKAGVRSVIGTQGRYAPQVRYAQDLINDGYVGRVIGTTMVGSGMVRGPEAATRQAEYYYDNAHGATPLTSPFSHAVDPLNHVLGDFEKLSANLVVGRTEARITADGGTVPITAPDQVAVIGTLTGGAAASVFYRGGTSQGDNFRWEIRHRRRPGPLRGLGQHAGRRSLPGRRPRHGHHRRRPWRSPRRTSATACPPTFPLHDRQCGPPVRAVRPRPRRGRPHGPRLPPRPGPVPAHRRHRARLRHGRGADPALNRARSAGPGPPAPPPRPGPSG